jgi:hypothetical protein
MKAAARVGLSHQPDAFGVAQRQGLFDEDMLARLKGFPTRTACCSAGATMATASTAGSAKTSAQQRAGTL